MEIVDGEGTRYNLVTPEQMVILLNDLYHDKNMKAIFFKALPQAGVSGTLKDRMKKTMLEKKFMPKRGQCMISLHYLVLLLIRMIRLSFFPLLLME